MAAKALGSSGLELSGYRLPKFLLHGKVLFDYGSLPDLPEFKSFLKIENILITHPCLDAICVSPFWRITSYFQRKGTARTSPASHDALKKRFLSLNRGREEVNVSGAEDKIGRAE